MNRIPDKHAENGPAQNVGSIVYAGDDAGDADKQSASEKPKSYTFVI